MRVGVLGINYKLADLKLREQLAKTCQKRFGAAQSIHDNHYFVLLSTCNRTEVYFSSEDLPTTHSYVLNILRYDVQEEEFDQKLYSYFGVDCFTHLTRVTSGLDSAIVAETEIQGQVKVAYETTLAYQALPKELHFLFQKALGIAKRIRSQLHLGRGMPHLEHAIFTTGKQFFKDLQQVNILFVGASEINYKILSYLKSKNLTQITLCNRSELSTKLISEKIQSLNWKSLKDWVRYDWIIFGTKSPDYLIKHEDAIPSLLGTKLVMDLCVPRNVEPKLSLHPSLTLLNIDQINQQLNVRHQGINEILTKAEHMVTQAAHLHCFRYLQKEQSKIALFAVAAC